MQLFLGILGAVYPQDWMDRYWMRGRRFCGEFRERPNGSWQGHFFEVDHAEMFG
jgi:hypothetical protein